MAITGKQLIDNGFQSRFESERRNPTTLKNYYAT